MLTAVVTFLGGWRATAFAAACLVLLGMNGYQQTRVWDRDHEIVQLHADADQHAAEDATAALKAEKAAREIEDKRAKDYAKIEEKRQQELSDANTAAAELRAGVIRVRRELAACTAAGRVPEAATPADDASAELRAAVTATLDIGHEADVELRACQARLIADRQSTE